MQIKASKNSATTEPTTPDPTDPTAKAAADPCNNLSNPSTNCGMISGVEGNGSYGQKNPDSSASGRFQFVGKTAIEQVVAVRKVNEADARSLWDECGRSSSAKCQKLQNDMCNHYSGVLEEALIRNGHPTTNLNKYLSHNQGARGFNVIETAAKAGVDVTDQGIRDNMQFQAWNKPTPTYNGAEYKARCAKYMTQRGLDIN